MPDNAAASAPSCAKAFIQKQATVALGARFKEYDINCVAVLIGRPESKTKEGKEDPIERLFDQLRQRRLADEQKATYLKQQEVAENLRQFKQAEAAAANQYAAKSATTGEK